MIGASKLEYGSRILMTCFLALDAHNTDIFKRFAAELKARGGSLVVASPDVDRIRDDLDLGFELLALPVSLTDYNATEYVDEKIYAEPFDTWLAEVDSNWWGGVFGRDTNRSLQGIPHCTYVARQVIAAVRPSVALIWSSGVYPVSRVWHDVARQMGIPTFCLERGFLPDTWMIDAGGMNAQSDMRAHPLIRRQLLQHTSTDRIESYRQYYASARPRKYGNPSEGVAAVRTKLGITGRLVVILGSLDCAGMVPRSILGAKLNSPGYADSHDVARAVGHALQDEPDLDIVFKAHPGESANFTENAIGKVKVVDNVDAIDLIQAADVVVAGLTGLAFETLLNKRPLVLVARSPLQGTGAAFEALNSEELGAAIRNALQGASSEKQQKADNFLDGLLAHCLYATKTNVPALSFNELAEHCVGMGGLGALDLEKADLVFKSVAPRYTAPKTEYAQLFFDTGSGFNEAESVKKIISRSVTRIQFELPQDIDKVNSFRLDPLNDYAAIQVDAISFITNDGDAIKVDKYEANTTFVESEICYFNHNDPQIIIKAPHAISANPRSLVIDLGIIARGHVVEILTHKAEVASLNQAVTERDGQIGNLNQLVSERDAQIASIYKSLSWRLTSPLRLIHKELRAIFRSFN